MRLVLIVPLAALLVALLAAGCGGRSGSYSPPASGAGAGTGEANLMRSERGGAIKRDKREDPLEPSQRP